jgi:N-methylhydantoinase B
MVQDSGGAGRWRGGLGYRRTLLATAVPITGSQCSDRHEVKPWPIFGGEPGGNGGTLIRKAGSTEWKTVRERYGKISSSKYANITIEPGDRIMLTTPGGGGYGDPAARDPAAVAEDVREGYISRVAAMRCYGYDATDTGTTR